MSFTTTTCSACFKQFRQEYKTHEDINVNDGELHHLGWLERKFGKKESIALWFCCTECAYESHQAKQMEEWWDSRDHILEEIKYERLITIGTLLVLIGLSFILWH